MALPKEPRQQMITMMYLVLTALLALNVSAEILKAFNVITDSLEKTNIVFESKNDDLFDFFEREKDDPSFDIKYFNQAKEIREEARRITSFIQNAKNDLIDRGGNSNGQVDADDYENADFRIIKKQSDTDISSTYFLVEDNGKRASELRNLLTNGHDRLLEIVEKKAGELEVPLTVPKDPPINDGVQKTWQEALFQEMPLAAAVTILTKLENDVKATESALLSEVYGEIHSDKFKFDVVHPIVIPNSEYLIQGEKYNASVLLAAYDSKKNPEIIIKEVDKNGNTASENILPVNSGKGTLELEPDRLGKHYYQGEIKVEDPETGELKSYAFKDSFTVVPPSVSISPTRMNVLYIGVENPITIASSGIQSENMSPSISEGRLLKKNDGSYTAIVEKPGIVNISVMAKTNNNSLRQMGKQEFRVKWIPKPIAKIGGLTGSSKLRASEMRVQRGIYAELEDFVFDLRFKIVSYEVFYAPKRGNNLMESVKGPLFDDIEHIIKNCKPGDVFFFSNIKAQGPDGRKRDLETIKIEII